MQQREENLSGGAWLVRTAFLVTLLAGSFSRPVLSDPAGPSALDLKMTMTTGSRISVGEPVAVHYTIKNTATAGPVAFHFGQRGDEWYTFSLTDTKGRTVKAAPPQQPEETEGLQLTPDTSIMRGSSTQGDIVVTRYLAVPGPGVYTLTIHTMTPYYVEPDGTEWSPEDRPTDMPLVDHTQDFRFPLTVTAADPTALRTEAEALRRKLLEPRYEEWDGLTEQLFSMPEADVLPVWQSLLADRKTNEFVLRTAADQLAFHPSEAHADLIALAFSEGKGPWDTFHHSWVSRVLFKMYQTADGPLKQHIRALYTAHGDSSIDEIEGLKAGHPN